jgi:signal transduction histidine kinase
MMPGRNRNQPLREQSFLEPHQHSNAMPSSPVLRLPWWRSHITGYVISPFLVGVMTIARLFVTEPLFIWAPFCLVVVVVGFFWGVGPALFAMTLALLAISYLVIPQYDLLTLNIWNDITLFGPFVVVQFLIALLAARHAVLYRRVLAAKQEAQTYAHDLAITNRQLERTKRLQEVFFSRAAHELRTPLTTILGEAQLALRRLHKAAPITTDMAIWRTHFEKIEERTRGLHTLVEDVIDIYHIRSEETELKQAPCDVGSLCREIVENQHAFSGRQIELQLPSEPVILQADYERLHQVVVNLVDNAIKYTPENTRIQVYVRSEPTVAVLEVHNEDAELSQEQQERIFEPFYRTPTAEALFSEGWGLGLTMSKAYVKRYGGRIWVESSEGKGVTFFVELPFQAVS